MRILNNLLSIHNPIHKYIQIRELEMLFMYTSGDYDRGKMSTPLTQNL